MDDISKNIELTNKKMFNLEEKISKGNILFKISNN